MKTFRIQKNNLIKVVPYLVRNNISFKVQCSGHLPYYNSGLNKVLNTKLGGKYVSITLPMTGNQFHRMLVKTCGNKNLQTWK